MPNINLNFLLINSEPDGIKKITIPGWTGFCYIFPRNKLREVKSSNELRGQKGIYFLFGEDIENRFKKLVYIGKGGTTQQNSIIDRLSFHNTDKAKDFWRITVVFSYSDYENYHDILESSCIRMARESDRFDYIIQNGNNPQNQPNENNRAFIEQFLNYIKIILSCIGYPVLQEIEDQREDNFKTPLFYCKRNNPNIEAKGRMTNEGFIIYKGSQINKNPSTTVTTLVARNKRLISRLLEEGAIKDNGDNYIFEVDYKGLNQNSASLILGYAVNGWGAWKTKDNKTLNEVYREN